MRVFNLAEELEKERKKSKELEEEIKKLKKYKKQYIIEAGANHIITQRIDKAVETIKKYGYEKQMEEDYLMNRVNLANYNCLLLDILKGDNK